MDVQVTNEFNPLKSIIIHRPGPELDLMTPENIEAHSTNDAGITKANPDYLLFDDLVLLTKLRLEHDQIVRVLTATCGREKTLELHNLLRTLLHNTEAKSEVVNASASLEKELWGNTVDNADISLMLDLDPHTLVKTLLRGVTTHGRRILKWPLPNIMFTRDLAAVVNDNIVLTYARKPARRREMLITRALFRHHPEFSDTSVLDIGPMVDDPALEGGDIIVLNSDQVAIGVGQRSNRQSALAAADLLIKNGVNQVYLVSIAAQRSTMHLDTVFTLASHHQCLAYSPLMMDKSGTEITSIGPNGKSTQRTGSWLDVLAEDGLELDVIQCGGDDPIHQTREQWSDGANAFALAPGKILLYARNERTLEQLNRAQFEILTPDEYCRNAALVLSEPDRRVVVAIQGSELSRGRGGPRCLTFPINRQH